MDASSQIAALMEAVDEIQAALAELDPTPRVLDYMAAASSYERMIESWPAAMPSDAQRDAVFECVMELHSEVVAVSGVRAVAKAFLAFVDDEEVETATATGT